METPVKKDRVSTIENDNKVLRRFYDPTGRPRIGIPDVQRVRWVSAVPIAAAFLMGAVVGVGIWLIVVKVMHYALVAPGAVPGSDLPSVVTGFGEGFDQG
jgi:hypothetical protein